MEIKKYDLVGLPSGEIMTVSEKQFRYLRDEEMIVKVISYLDIPVDAWCFDDKTYGDVKMMALAATFEHL